MLYLAVYFTSPILQWWQVRSWLLLYIAERIRPFQSHWHMSILLFEEVQALEQASFQGKGGIHFLLNASDKDIHSQHLWVTFKIIFIVPYSKLDNSIINSENLENTEKHKEKTGSFSKIRNKAGILPGGKKYVILMSGRCFYSGLPCFSLIKTCTALSKLCMGVSSHKHKNIFNLET